MTDNPLQQYLIGFDDCEHPTNIYQEQYKYWTRQHPLYPETTLYANGTNVFTPLAVIELPPTITPNIDSVTFIVNNDSEDDGA